MELTNKRAKELSILKWEYIVENNDSKAKLLKTHPELRELANNCGYCQLYVKWLKNCPGCPLRIHGMTCFNSGHPFYVWNKKRTVETAQAVLDLIIKS